MTPYSFLSWNAQLNHRSSDPPALYCKPPAESFLPVACREGHKFRLSFRHSAQHITRAYILRETDCTEPRFTTTGRRKRREREGGRARGRAVETRQRQPQSDGVRPKPVSTFHVMILIFGKHILHYRVKPFELITRVK